MATPTAAPTKQTISHPIPPNFPTATLDCKAGLPPWVPLPPSAPASPEGVAAALSPGTTVTAVTVLWLPSGNVVVCRTTDVLEGRRVVRVEPEVMVGDEEPRLEDLERVT